MSGYLFPFASSPSQGKNKVHFTYGQINTYTHTLMSILLFHVSYAAYDVEMLDDKVPMLVTVSCVLDCMQLCI